MNKVIIIITLLITGCIQAKSTLPLESERLFTSSVFESYLTQLNYFVTTHHTPEDNPDTADLKTYILNSQLSDHRTFYKEMILKLRTALQNDPNSLFLDQFCVWMFEEVELWDDMVAYMVNEFGAIDTSEERISVPEMLAHLKDVYQKTCEDPRYCDYKRSPEDPLLSGNIPYFLFSLANQTKVFRIPTVVKVQDKVEVAEEFHRYLMVKAKTKSKHFYLNLKNTNPIKTTLHALELKPELENFLNVLTIDKSKSSNFYWQTGKFKYIKKTDDFINAFLAQHFNLDNSTHFCWSNNLDVVHWYHQSKHLMTDIHQNYFEGKAEVNITERLDFIDIFYMKMTQLICAELNIDSLNISCEHSIDRAPGILGHLFLDNSLDEQGKMSLDDANRFIALIVIQPLLLHNRPAHDYRVNRLISICERMYEGAAGKPTAHR